jgi:hypothetical protein
MHTHLLAMESRGSSRRQQLTERSVTVAVLKMAHLDDEVWNNQAIGRVLSAFEKWRSGPFLHFHQSRAAHLTISLVHCSSSPYDQCHRFDCCCGFDYPSLCLSKRSLPFSNTTYNAPICCGIASLCYHRTTPGLTFAVNI